MLLSGLRKRWLVRQRLTGPTLRAAVPGNRPGSARYLPRHAYGVCMAVESRPAPDESDLPAFEAIADDLWTIAVAGLVNVEIGRLAALPQLGVLCRPGTVPPARALDLRSGLRVLLRRLGREAPLRQRAELLLGATSATASLPIEDRLDAIGRTYTSRRGPGSSITGKTVRNSGRARAIVEELADVVLAAERKLRSGGMHPAAGEQPLYAPRAIYAVTIEERLGYRWLSYHRRLRGPDEDGSWDDQTTLVLEAVRPGVTRVELDYQADDGQQELAATWTSLRDGRPRVASVEPAPYILPTPYYVGVRDRPWWRAWIELRLDLPEDQPVELILQQRTQSERINWNYDQPNQPEDWRWITTIAVTPLFDSLRELTLRAEIVGHRRDDVQMFSREVLAIGPYRFTGRDDITLREAEGAMGTEIHGSYATSTPTAGMVYELNVCLQATSY